jgi:hypothetical protein
MCSIFFSYYEQDMEKSNLVLNYYNNVYKGWHEWQWAMSTIILGEEIF